METVFFRNTTYDEMRATKFDAFEINYNIKAHRYTFLDRSFADMVSFMVFQNVRLGMTRVYELKYISSVK